jgi:transcriptional regulator with GAF, ATPase, and Fis domain
MRQISHIIRLVGARRATVLITGETGTGKELAARALHMAGNRAGKPMVSVNCSALSRNASRERALWSLARGLFTGAWQSAPDASKKRLAGRSSSTKSANCP